MICFRRQLSPDRAIPLEKTDPIFKPAVAPRTPLYFIRRLFFGGSAFNAGFNFVRLVFLCPIAGV